MTKRKVCLIVIDGWGMSDKTEGNAIHHAETPVMDTLCQGPGYTTLDASSLSVGLPEGLMGNSEVGHLSIGAGRVLYQDIIRINMTSSDNLFHENEAFLKSCEAAKAGTNRLHLLGLVSDGGVHSHITHLFSMLAAAKKLGVGQCFMHYFGDGRDTRPTSGVTYVKQLQDKMKELGYGSIGSVTGRYYAMDRDKRYERTKLAYEGLVQGIGESCPEKDLIAKITERYNKEGDAAQTDEFLKPIICNAEGNIRDGDRIVFINFRADRMRQIVEAIGVKPQFETNVIPKDLHVTCMTEYKKEFTFPVMFPPVRPVNVLAEWLSERNIKQYHVAETEKYAHVTFFFNGGREAAFANEDRCLVPSPKVPTYDLQPEMSAAGVADAVVAAVEKGEHEFVMLNFAPPDMVGHTGKYEPAVKACAATDVAIGRIRKACDAHDYVMLVTADHGNAEQMISEAGGPHTAHTTYRVPFCATQGIKFTVEQGYNAALRDVAPTVLALMGLDQPEEMTGRSLLAG